MNTKTVTRRAALGMFAASWAAPAFSASAGTPAVLVHKDPNCGCCAGWVQHLRDNGFSVEIDEAENLAPVRRRLGVPEALAACHTAEVAGYVVEGHVPASAIRRLLQERPDARGLAVPGMPVGSPGMEGSRTQRYAAILFGRDGQGDYMRFEGARQID
jgi:hypothetical protein